MIQHGKEHDYVKEPINRRYAFSRTWEKLYGVNEFVVQGRPYRLPMWLINGAGEGPTLVVTAGVHAAEYASIAAALELGRSLDPASLSAGA